MSTWQKSTRNNKGLYTTMEKWNKEIEEKIKNTTNDKIRYWLQHQLYYNKNYLNGKTQEESDDTCVPGW